MVQPVLGSGHYGYTATTRETTTRRSSNIRWLRAAAVATSPGWPRQGAGPGTNPRPALGWRRRGVPRDGLRIGGYASVHIRPSHISASPRCDTPTIAGRSGAADVIDRDNLVSPRHHRWQCQGF